MTERPIIFSGPMVRALTAGRKTQTRRIVKGVDECPHGYDGVVKQTVQKEAHLVGQHCFQLASGETAYIRCPYGAPGDRLWVRETFRDDFIPHENPDREGTHVGYLYRADPDEKDEKRRPWKPAIHMPRAACRLRLDVAAVRIERLQDISEEDAKAEGAVLYQGDEDPGWSLGYGRFGSATAAYFDLWQMLNAKRAPWASNPWVWVIEFKREKR